MTSAAPSMRREHLRADTPPPWPTAVEGVLQRVAMILGPRARSLLTSLPLVAALGVAALAGACGTGSTTGSASTTASGGAPAAPEGKPTVRLYALSTVAGALEPCGCSKDQLGGIDHLAAFITAEKPKVAESVLVAAGPLFFLDPTLSPQKATQDKWKAEAMAASLAKLSPLGWAPGANDYAAGAADLEKLEASAKLARLGVNVTDKAYSQGRIASYTHPGGTLRVGYLGVVDPKALSSAASGLETTAPLEALRDRVKAIRKEGANLVVVSAAMQRGEALRLVDAVPDIDVLVVGKAVEKGDLNDKPKAAQLLGQTLVVETSNHLQTVGVIDLFIREPTPEGQPIKLADAGGVVRAEEIVGLTDQIRELENRINGWEKDKVVKVEDLAARRRDLEQLRRKRADLEKNAPPPPSGSYFRYQMVEVRDGLGVDKAVAADVLAYYKRVNDHNKTAFADRKPVAAAEGQATYMGIENCTSCHAEERAVWDKTQHAKAYATLEKQFVEYNLDCVGCHVTGYEKPGGSTVTAVEKLKDVGCEVCHGPGSLHANDPSKKGLVIVKPEPKTCVSECHHPPHVEGFDPVAKMQQILGPGHGL